MTKPDITERLEIEAQSPYLHPDVRALLSEASATIRMLRSTLSVYRIAGEPQEPSGWQGLADFMARRRKLKHQD